MDKLSVSAILILENASGLQMHLIMVLKHALRLQTTFLSCPEPIELRLVYYCEQVEQQYFTEYQ